MPRTPRGNTWISIDDPADIEIGTRALAEDLNLAALYDEVANFGDLPPRGTRIGHHLRVVATNIVYVWNGTAWIALTRGLNADGNADEATIRTLGTGPRQAASGSDFRLSNQRTPTDGSVSLAKIAPDLLPSAGAPNGSEALRRIGREATAAAGGDVVHQLVTDWRVAVPFSNYVPADTLSAESYFLGLTGEAPVMQLNSARGAFWAPNVFPFAYAAPAGYSIEWKVKLRIQGGIGSPTSVPLGISVHQVDTLHADGRIRASTDTALRTNAGLRVYAGSDLETPAGTLHAGRLHYLLLNIGSITGGVLHGDGYGMAVGGALLYRYVAV